MKFNYYGYSFVDRNARNKKYLFDLRGILKKFARLDSPVYKNGFTYCEDNLYLFEHSADCYLFVITRNKELIKKVDTRKIGVSELNAELAKEGSLVGFASLILMEQNYFAIGTATLSPKLDVFSAFINQILASLGTTGYEFVPRAFVHKSTKKDVMCMEIVGRSVIEIPNLPGGALSDLINAMTGATTDISELDGVEIIFKPKTRRSNIKEVVSASLNNLDEISKAVIKAKNEVASTLQELYLTKDGGVFDHVNGEDDNEIFDKLKAKCEGNKLLLKKIEEFKDDKSFRRNEINSLVCLNDDSSWSSIAICLQAAEQ